MAAAKFVNPFTRYIQSYDKKTLYKPENEENVSGKIVVITGANSGIGEVAGLEMAKRGGIVVLACRDMIKAAIVLDKIKQKAPGSRVELVELNLGDMLSIRKCAMKIRSKFKTIDILINNAGVAYDDAQRHTTKDGFESHMGVNHLGHFLFTMLLLDLIKNGGPGCSKNRRIVNVSSGMALYGKIDFDDLMLSKPGAIIPENKMGPYANSKLANIYFTRGLARKLEGTGIKSYALCPGIVKTNIMRNTGEEVDWSFGGILTDQKYILTPEEGVETILYCSLSKECGKESGEMYQFNKRFENMIELDSSVERMLWQKSETLVGI